MGSDCLRGSLEPLKVMHEGWHQLPESCCSDLFPGIVCILNGGWGAEYLAEGFQWTCPDSSEESLSMAATALRNVFLQW